MKLLNCQNHGVHVNIKYTAALNCWHSLDFVKIKWTMKFWKIIRQPRLEHEWKFVHVSWMYFIYLFCLELCLKFSCFTWNKFACSTEIRLISSIEYNIQIQKNRYIFVIFSNLRKPLNFWFFFNFKKPLHFFVTLCKNLPIHHDFLEIS